MAGAGACLALGCLASKLARCDALLNFNWQLTQRVIVPSPPRRRRTIGGKGVSVSRQSSSCSKTRYNSAILHIRLYRSFGEDFTFDTRRVSVMTGIEVHSGSKTALLGEKERENAEKRLRSEGKSGEKGNDEAHGQDAAGRRLPHRGGRRRHGAFYACWLAMGRPFPRSLNAEREGEEDILVPFFLSP